MAAPDWSLAFELMCDASDFALGVVLGQRKTESCMLYIILVELEMMHNQIMQLWKRID